MHLAPFPEDRGRRDDGLDRAEAAVRTPASLAPAARDAAGLRVRQPLAGMRVAVPAAVDVAALERLLPLLATHLTFPEIGERLFVSRNTVKTQAISIYQKLAVSSRSDAIERARTCGLLGS